MSGFWSNFDFVSKFEKQEVVISGILAEDPDITEKGEQRISVKLEKIGSKDAGGRLFAIVKNKVKLRRSDRVFLRGKLSKGSRGTVGVIFRAQFVKLEKRTDLVRDIRDSFAGGIKQFISSPEVDLGLGYLLGQKNSLPETLETALKITALTHIVVASGYNLTVLANFSRRIFQNISRKLTLLLMILLVGGFVLVVGFTPSMVRAGIVAILSAIFWYFGKRTNPYFLLIFVATMTLFIRPENIFGLGWQLSFASFFGVMILSPKLKEFLFREPEKLPALISTFFETFSAQISTLPLIVSAFGVFSTVSMLSNFFVLPLVPPAMLMVFLTGFFAQVFTPLAQVFGWASEMILKISINIIDFFAGIPGAQMEVKIPDFVPLIFYAILALFVLFLEKSTRKTKIMLENPAE